ncbi:MAG: hypothetical protein AAGE59_18540 [Cyanobacteria bacterium P01_F01_bin.86]
MKALFVSSLTMMMIVSGSNANTLHADSTDDRTAKLDSFELMNARRYEPQNRQYGGGGGTGRREILSRHSTDSAIV